MTYINGPINIVRLEGDIYGIKKKMYLFMDIHSPKERETKCNEENSQDIVEFLKNEFNKNRTDMLDFFFEITKPNIEHVKNMSDERYIARVAKLFAELINIKNDDKDKFPKVRFHYIDIREYYKEKIQYERIKIIHNMNDQNMIKKHIRHIINILEDTKKSIKNIEECNSETKCIFDKILNKYTNKDAIDKIKKMFDIIVSMIDETIININNEKKYDSENIKEIFNKLIMIYGYLTDVYILRRFIDKNYIKHVIVYSGIGHSLNIINFLVKEYKMKITDVSNSITPIDELNDNLKEYLSYDELFNLFNKGNIKQCSKLLE